jgi:phage tail protein X
MIFFDSRYATGEIRRAFDSRNDKYRLTVFRSWPYLSATFLFYEWVDGDRVDVIAEKFYGRAELWWRILDANPEIIDPLTIAPGTVIRIPNE